MKENKTDARVIKTKQRIEATFLRMLAEMPFEKLTTTLLIKECLISKGTFYAHYLDKYDLAEQLIDRELQLFETLLTQRFENKQTSLEQLSQMATKRSLLKFTLNILYLLGCTVDRK
ncbi:TetR/AcrR family transcriptional regulator [Streptococcus halitosis]|uniref:TetR/AcrR family transcriptional regulator n=1 Tax=Streptococcus halitosis TaxID=2172545 RepID=A0A3R8LTJ3_9STRE|nr:transcriptional regulator, TetR family [Streptococcus sp. SR1]NIB85388.1 TetR/AcrR family transcriptional regulator [Streptococcus sp. CCUG 71758]RRN46375.1 TetR/AcrR family transcriptional regulator [Streptococcus halitosis]